MVFARKQSDPPRQPTRFEQFVKVVLGLLTFFLLLVGVVAPVSHLISAGLGFYVLMVGVGWCVIWVTVGGAYLLASARIDDQYPPSNMQRLHWVPWILFVALMWAVLFALIDLVVLWFLRFNLFGIVDPDAGNLIVLVLIAYLFFVIGRAGSRLVLRRFRANLREHKRCVQCGYDLSHRSAVDAFKCPECGTMQPAWWRDETI